MKKIIRSLLVLLVLLSVPTISALAFQGETPPDSLLTETLLKLIFGLSITVPGVGLLIPALINIGKAIGWVKDNQAALIVNILNLAFAVFFGLTSLLPHGIFPAWT